MELSFAATLSETTWGILPRPTAFFTPPRVDPSRGRGLGSCNPGHRLRIPEADGLFADAEGLLRINSSNEAKPDEILRDVDNNPVMVAFPRSRSPCVWTAASISASISMATIPSPKANRSSRLAEYLYSIFRPNRASTSRSSRRTDRSGDPPALTLGPKTVPWSSSAYWASWRFAAMALRRTWY